MNYPDLSQVNSEIEELNSKMSDPVVSQNPQEMQELSREHARKSELAVWLTNREKRLQELKEAEELAGHDDEEMRAMAVEDVDTLKHKIREIEAEIEGALLPQDPRDKRNVILELRAGAGGDESSLFAAELFRAYTRYAEACGWKIHTLSSSLSDQGGFKEIIAEVSGKEVFGTIKYERGVHRVQRVPETEKLGRIHTSTVTVAVIPQAEEKDLVIKPDDLRIDTYRSGGAGGQHVNKTSSAIRITHLPTNTVVAVQDERSQFKNKEKAMKILRSRLLEAEEEARQAKEASERRQQVGTGDRSEKIRTYNFPQDRVTDHRIKESWSNIERIMGGGWEPIFTALKEADKQLKIKSLGKVSS
jgi:peptide chain release factor 1